MRRLSSPFSAQPEQAYLSYAQSYSLVEFLIDEYGGEDTLHLLSTFRRGSSYDEALERVYGFDMDGLDVLWRGVLDVEPMAEEKGLHPAWVTFFSIVGLAALLLVVVIVRRRLWGLR